MVGSRRSTIKAIETFFTKSDSRKKLPGNGVVWPPDLIATVQDYVDSHSAEGPGASSYSTKIHEDLLHLQKLARENSVSEACFLQCLVLFTPLLVNKDQLQEWFKAYVGPAINSAGNSIESVEASRSFLLAVLNHGTCPLVKAANEHQSTSDSTEPEDSSNSLPAISNNSSTFLSENPALSPLILPETPVPQSSIASSSLINVDTLFIEENTPSSLFFSWILDTYSCLHLEQWFSFGESGIALEERLRVVVKSSRDLLLKWASSNEQLFFQRLDFYKARNPNHRQLSFSLTSQFVSQNPTSNIGAIANTNLLNTLLNSLLYDTSQTALNIGSKVLAMVVPYIASKLTNNMIFKLFLIYGRLACWNSFNYDFSLPKSSQKSKEQNTHIESKVSSVDDIAQKLPVPKGWRLISKAFDLPEIQLIDVAPLFTSLYGLWPSNFLSFIREPTEFIIKRTNATSLNEKDISKSSESVPFPDVWNSSCISDRSLQLFYSHCINPLLIRFTIDQELNPKSISSVGTPIELATFCNSLRERFVEVFPQSRRQSSFAARSTQSTKMNAVGSKQTGQTNNQTNENNDEESYFNSLFENEQLEDTPDSCSSHVEFNNDFGSNKNYPEKSEVPLVASPIVYRKNSGSWEATPRFTFTSDNMKNADNLISEHEKLFTKSEASARNTNKNPTYGNDLLIDDFSLNDPAPTVSDSKQKDAQKATVPSSFLSLKSLSPKNSTRNSMNNSQVSPLSRPKTVVDIMSSPMLVGQSAPSSSVTHVVVNSPPVSSISSGSHPSSSPSISNEPDVIRLSPKSTYSNGIGINASANPSGTAISSVLSDTLQNARGSPRMSVSTYNSNNHSHTPPLTSHTTTGRIQNFASNKNVTGTNNAIAKSNMITTSTDDTSTLFYHREFSILRNEFDFVLFCEFHSRSQLRELQKSRLTDRAFLQTVERLSLSNQSLHNRISEMTNLMDKIEEDQNKALTKQRDFENSSADRILTFQRKTKELENELQKLKDQHAELGVLHADLLALAVKKEEKVSYLELRVDELSKEQERSNNYKKALEVVEGEKTELLARTESYVPLEDAYATENLLTKFKEVNLAKVAAEKAKDMSDRQSKIQINSLQAMLRDAQQQFAKPSKPWLESYEAYVRQSKQENKEIKEAYNELSQRFDELNEKWSAYHVNAEAKLNFSKAVNHSQKLGNNNSGGGLNSSESKDFGAGGSKSPEAGMIPMYDYVETDSMGNNGGSSTNSIRSVSTPWLHQQHYQSGASSPTNFQNQSLIGNINSLGGNEPGISESKYSKRQQKPLSSTGGTSIAGRSKQSYNSNNNSNQQVNRPRGRGGIQNSTHGSTSTTTSRGYRTAM